MLFCFSFSELMIDWAMASPITQTSQVSAA